MNRIDRLSAILIQLQSKRVVTAKEIAQRFDISVRTVYRDIRALEAAGIPIGSDAGLGYYLADGYHLPPVMLTTEEACALITAGKLTEKFSDVGVKEHFNSALYKIKAVLKDQDKDRLEKLQNKIGVFNIAEEKTDSKSGFITDIQSALCGKNVILIEYYSPQNTESTSRKIEPISLGFYEFHWHLIAYCRLRNEYRDFRIDRIKKLSLTNETFDEKGHPPIQTLLMKMLDYKKRHQVTLRFNKNVSYEIIKNKCILGFVEEKDLGSKIEMILLVDSLQVLGKWLLDYATDVEIISPVELKQIMQQYAAAIAKQYLNLS